MLTLYQMERSPYCDKVRRILRYKGIPFDVHEVSMLQGSKHSRTGKLPALDLDGKYIDDSTQIAHAIELQFPEPSLIPAHPGERALCHMLEDWADESLYYYEMALHFTFEENVQPRLDQLTEHDTSLRRSLIKTVFPPVLRHLLWAQGTGRRGHERVLEDVTRHVQAIAGWLGDRQYLVSSDLTLADIAVFCQLSAMCETKQGKAICDAEPTVTAWLLRVRQRTGG